jgi:hypothetical protein
VEVSLEISVSRKKIGKIIAVVIVSAFLFAVALIAWNNGLSGRLMGREQRETVMFNLPPEHPVLSSLAAFYAPSPSASMEAWQDQVCAGMTERGCKLFKGMYAPAMWNAAQRNHIGADMVNFVEDVEILDDGRRVWKLEVQVFEGQEGGEYNEHTFDVYVEVAKDEPSGNWLLDRILFNEEVQARFGESLAEAAQ